MKFQASEKIEFFLALLALFVSLLLSRGDFRVSDAHLDVMERAPFVWTSERTRDGNFKEEHRHYSGVRLFLVTLMDFYKPL